MPGSWAAARQSLRAAVAQAVAPGAGAPATVALPPVAANLAHGSGYLACAVVFTVSRSAWARAGAIPAPGGTGTGSPALDARVKQLITQTALTFTASQLQGPDGPRMFARRLRRALNGVFGPHAVRSVYLSQFLIQP